MSGEPGDVAGDFYAVLGVPPGADARAIKVAYFALVRRFSPERHPEEFLRIREAYEVLGDPERRAFYDAWRRSNADELAHGPELEALRQGFLQARAQGALEPARRLLERTLELAPGRDDARHALALVLLDLGQWPDAEAHLRRLLEVRPEAFDLRCDLVRVLAAAGKRADARAELARLQPLAGADPDAHARLADLLALLARFAEAREEVRLAMGLAGGTPPSPELVRRLARILLLESNPDGATATLVEAAQAWAGSEGEQRRAALAVLAGGAAMLFEAGETRSANEVLAACAAVDPGCCIAPVPYPVVVRREELPEATRAWIEAQREAPELAAQHYVPNERQRMIVIGLVLLLGFMLLAAGVPARGPRVSEARRFGGFVFLVSVLLGAVAVQARAIVRARFGAFGIGLVLHPLHVLAVEQDRVRVIPLLHVRNVEADGIGGVGRVRVFTDAGVEATSFGYVSTSNHMLLAIRYQVRKVLAALSSGELQELERHGDFPAALFAPRSAPQRLADLRLHRLLAGVAGVVALSFAVALAFDRWLG